MTLLKLFGLVKDEPTLLAQLKAVAQIPNDKLRNEGKKK